MSAAASSTEPRLPQPGDRIAERYVVESRLAMGGMGVVVVARHELLGERFAIKVLKPELLGTHDVSRFLREAQSCVGLRGEHAVRVFDVGTLPSGLPFMVMELLEGHDMRRELEQRGALPVDEATTWIIEACHALAEAHARGIVHRDIKPGNLFLAMQPDGRRIVKVVDFGISKLLDEPISDESPRLTQTIGLLGSPQYMSPEQVRSASRVDHRSDIWSLGCVLYELLTAIPAFAGESISSVSAMIVVDEPTPLERLRPKLPAELIFAVMGCLTKDRTQRIQSVAELAELLEPYALGAPGTSERVLNILRAGNVPPSSRGAMRVSGVISTEAETLANVAVHPALVEADEPVSARQSAVRIDRGAPTPPRETASRKRRAIVGVGAAAGVALVVGVLVCLGMRARSVEGPAGSVASGNLPHAGASAEAPERSGKNSGAPVIVSTAAVAVPKVETPRTVVSAVPATRTVVPNSGGAVRAVAPVRGAGQAAPEPTPDPGGKKKLNDILSERR
jgi:serine/threonine-protein kinase